MSDTWKVVAIVVLVLLLAAWRAWAWVRKARVLTRVGLDLAEPDRRPPGGRAASASEARRDYDPPDEPPERP
jgi:hypothetical protein